MSKFQKFLFFLASLIPGAGHMFLGFMKRGLLLMTIYFIDIGLSMLVNGFLVFMPVIWFYCFFDAWNKFFLSDDEKKRVDDSFIFFYNAIPEELLPKSKRFSNKIPQKFYRFAGLTVGFFGIVMLCKELRGNLALPKYVEQVLAFMPELLISLALIFTGIRLILHKKKEIFGETDSDDIATQTLPIEPAPKAEEKEEENTDPIEEIKDETEEEIKEEKPLDIPSVPTELLKSIADDSLRVKSSDEDEKAENEELEENESSKEIELASQSILNDIDASLSPILENIEKDAGAKDIEYIWSSPVKTNDNPQ